MKVVVISSPLTCQHKKMSAKKNKKWAGLEKLVFHPPLATHEGRHHFISAHLPAQENKQK